MKWTSISAAVLGLVGCVWGAPRGQTIVTLEVESAKAPVPALRYQLLPPFSDLRPGNPIGTYLKCFAEQNHFFFDKEKVAERERLSTCNIGDIPPGTLKGYGGSALRIADESARLETPDWNLLLKLKEEGFNLLLPDLQQMRILATALKVKARGQIIDGDFDGALRTIQTIFALSRHVGEHPCLIGSLVASAIASTGLDVVEDLMCRPKAPSLFWALNSYPRPVIDVRKSVGGERLMVDAMFGPLMNPKRVWGNDEIADARRRVDEVSLLVEFRAGKRAEARDWLIGRLKDDDWLKKARRDFVARGYPEEKVVQYPVEQVAFMRIAHSIESARDEVLKWMFVPYPQADEAMARLSQEPKDIEAEVAGALGFPLVKVRNTLIRTEQRLAMLMVAESLRLHAGSAGGKLPDSLDGIHLPIPVDPVTGKAFEYRKEGNAAFLIGRETSIAGGGSWKPQYEVRIRR